MQTFLPYPDFVASAQALDYRRLGKQRVECNQLLDAIRYGGGWRNHPAARMWRHYPNALTLYRNIVIQEWRRRGYVNSLPYLPISFPVVYPWWFGDPAFHASHRSNLLRKDPAYYSQFNWLEPPTLEYIWPQEQP